MRLRRFLGSLGAFRPIMSEIPEGGDLGIFDVAVASLVDAQRADAAGQVDVDHGGMIGAYQGAAVAL